MNKDKIIRKSEDFSNIISTGHSLKNKYLSIYYKESKNTLYGITVPKKVGHAVIRNKLKRQVKNIRINTFLYIIRKAILPYLELLFLKKLEKQYIEIN